MSLYIDGAHTVESLMNCATWFKEETFKEKINDESFREQVDGKRFYRVLLFNLTGIWNAKIAFSSVIIRKLVSVCNFDQPNASFRLR